tara:strand:+ start:113 stop:1051 length:939 start_codon:yes stop_codon:yes gene_type:complete
MARHIYVGAEAAATYTAGVLGAGAIDIQKMSATGPTTLVMGDTVANAPQIRFVQGNGTTNIVSPWFYGRDLIDWSGRSYTAAVIDDITYTISALTATAAGEATIKFIDKTNGLEPFTFKSWTVAYAIGATATTIADALKAEIIADPAKFCIELQAATSNATIQPTGYAIGATDGYGDLVVKSKILDVAFEDVNGTDAARTIAGVVATSPSDGAGDGIFVKLMEERNHATQFGYHNRLELPNTPASYAVNATNYDMWHLAATKDGSSASQIHGVDNVIDITMANTVGSAANALLNENKLNAYCASVGFGPVTL